MVENDKNNNFFHKISFHENMVTSVRQLSVVYDPMKKVDGAGDIVSCFLQAVAAAQSQAQAQGYGHGHAQAQAQAQAQTQAQAAAVAGVGLVRWWSGSREAVLEYLAAALCRLADEALLPPAGPRAHQHHRSHAESDSHNARQSETVTLISNSLCGMNAAWAQILAPWSINLLKTIAARHSDCPVSELQNCELIRQLLNIATVNLMKLDEPSKIDCIDTMLANPQGDWVIGHIGRSDPTLVVPRVLELALQVPPSLKVSHVVSILNHLSPLHFFPVRQSLMRMFEDSLKMDVGDKERRKIIIPFLMQLASKSDVVLKALTKDINVASSTGMMEKLIKVCEAGIPGLDLASGRTSIVALALRAHTPVFVLILHWAALNPFCRSVLEQLLQKMEAEVRSGDGKIPLLDSITSDINNIRRKLLHSTVLEKYAVARVTILICYRLPSVFVNIVSYLMQNSQDDQTLAILVRIIMGSLSMRASIESTDQSPESNKILSLLRQAYENGLREALNAINLPEKCYVEDFKMSKNARRETCLERFCHNVATLLRWESTGKVPQLQNKPITRVCEMNLLKSANVFNELVTVVKVSDKESRNGINDLKWQNSMYICHAMATMIDLINIPVSRTSIVDVEILIKIIQASVKYFFRCLHETDIRKKLKGTQTAYRIFRRTCCCSKAARSVALRELLETALFREAEMFGSKIKDSLSNNFNFEKDNGESLMSQNHKKASIMQLTQCHTSVFHAGIIGNGVRKYNDKLNEKNIPSTSKETATMSNTTKEVELLFGAIMACMEDAALEGMTCVSLLLVELVSPDVMYNGLPWPDEDFTKVSIERELYIRQVFDNYPIVWHLLRLISNFRPALCYCSVLLRAVAATLIHQYAAKSDRYVSAENDGLNSVTIHLLDIMANGQLLPSPLNYINRMIPHLKPKEIVQILRDCIWNYTRDNVPSPALFTCDASGLHWRDPAISKPLPLYTDTLRVIIQKNISTLGYLYPLMFLDMEKGMNS